MNKFSIGYMINPKLNINKEFREQMDKCLNNTVGPITQNYIRATWSKKKIRVLALLMFYKTRKNYKIVFKVLSSVIITIISNDVCIDYLAFESRNKLKSLLVMEGVLNTEKTFWQNIGNWKSRLVNELNVLSWIFEEKKSVVILKCPKRILE